MRTIQTNHLVIEEALGIYRRLEDKSPDGAYDDMFVVYKTQGKVLASLGREQEALVSIQKCIALF